MLEAADVDQFKVVDTDSPVIEPYDLWTSRLSVRKCPATAAVSPRKFGADELGDLEPSALRKILHDNAARIYHLD